MPIKGIINLPGDKSISHRALMLASLTDGECVIHNISTGEDIKTTRRCLAQCGIISTQNEATIHIKGNSYKTPEKALDCGNSGTSARLLLHYQNGQRKKLACRKHRALRRSNRTQKARK